MFKYSLDLMGKSLLLLHCLVPGHLGQTLTHMCLILLIFCRQDLYFWCGLLLLLLFILVSFSNILHKVYLEAELLRILLQMLKLMEF